MAAISFLLIFWCFFPFSAPVVLCSGADVLGGHAAPQGDVSGQTWILSQRDVSRALSLEETAPGGRAWSAVPVLLPPTFPSAWSKEQEAQVPPSAVPLLQV